MTNKEVHDVANIVAPALSLTQNLLLGFYGELPRDQKQVITKIERCLKDLQSFLQQQAVKKG